MERPALVAYAPRLTDAALSKTFHTVKGKKHLLAELSGFFGDLALDNLRVVRPSKFLFLCGGAIKKDDPKAPPVNLRDYLWRVRPLKLSHPTVLAEDAVQLFRDSEYGDLITFEEDIARIAAVVLVIAESAGSLAELGAFVSNETISAVLRVVIQESYDKAESFVRYGPIQRIRRARREYLGVYPWRTAKDGSLLLSSTTPHYKEIKQFISNHIDSTPERTNFNRLAESRPFYIILWIVYMCKAVSILKLHEYVKLFEPLLTVSDLRRKLYCLILARWIDKTAYDDRDYYYTRFDQDVFDYAFKPSALDNKPVRRKLVVFQAHEKIEKLPAYIKKIAIEARKASLK